jgi:integrase
LGRGAADVLSCLATLLQQVAAAITATRKAQGMSVLRLANRTGELNFPIHRTAISKIEACDPGFAVTVLGARRALPYLGEQAMVFPSTAGTWRDPDNFRARWREVRDTLGVPDATSHSFRKTVATLIDDEGLFARIGADHLGHSRISMTQDKYVARGRVHTAVADMLERAISDE